MSETELDSLTEEHHSTGENGQAIVRKRPKRAAACSNFREKEFDLSEEDSPVKVKETRTEEETEAVRLTQTGSLTIRDEQCKEVTASEDEDAKLARLVQEAEEWKMAKKQRSKSGTSQKNVYIKISEAEIANDYPLPAYYKPYTTETDEHVIFDNEVGMSVNDLPVKILNNWALYNSDSRLVSLELVPMKPSAEDDIVIFGSGSVREDDDSFRSTAEAEQLSSSSSSKSDQKDDGIPIYLSPIKEWLVEFGSSVICITIRTSVAW
jgi:DNA (cytosine-5)-methyltransferase 1